MIDAFAIGNYRSLRDVVVPLRTLNVVTGANGSGKSSLYRALRLLVEIAEDRVIGSLAAEGGLPSVMWAGPASISKRMRSGEVPIEGTVARGRKVLRVGFAGEDIGYSAELGLPPPPSPGFVTRFALDPEIKRESIWAGAEWGRRTALLERKHGLVEARDATGKWEVVEQELATHASMLAWLGDPRRTPEVTVTRRRIQAWRFYDAFRSDRSAPARIPQVGTRTLVLGHEGSDLAAAIGTILEIGDEDAMLESLRKAFPAATIDVENVAGRFLLQFTERGLLRPLGQDELSDGTLRFLLWLAALHTPRPPELMVLNEPETSLHGDLLLPLAAMIRHAARSSQLIVVSHAPSLIAALQEVEGCNTIALRKDTGETMVHTDAEPASWTWPAR